MPRTASFFPFKKFCLDGSGRRHSRCTTSSRHASVCVCVCVCGEREAGRKAKVCQWRQATMKRGSLSFSIHTHTHTRTTFSKFFPCLHQGRRLRYHHEEEEEEKPASSSSSQVVKAASLHHHHLHLEREREREAHRYILGEREREVFSLHSTNQTRLLHPQAAASSSSSSGNAATRQHR